MYPSHFAPLETVICLIGMMTAVTYSSLQELYNYLFQELHRISIKHWLIFYIFDSQNKKYIWQFRVAIQHTLSNIVYRLHDVLWPAPNITSSLRNPLCVLISTPNRINALANLVWMYLVRMHVSHLTNQFQATQHTHAIHMPPSPSKIPDTTRQHHRVYLLDWMC